MKKTILLLAIAILSFQGVSAQFSLGVSGGLNLADAEFKSVDWMDSNIATYYFFGVIPKYDINSKFSVSADVQYSLKGFNCFDITSGLGDTKNQYVYLDVLPKVEYQIHKNIALGLGCNIGFLLDEKLKNGSDEWQSRKDVETIKSTDFGLVASVRGSYKNFFVSVAYNYGLGNITKIIFTDEESQIIEDAKQQNRNLQIGVGYFFQLKKDQE